MPDYSGSYGQQDTWTAVGAPSAVLHDLARAAGSDGADTATSFRASRGSRVALRLLGFWTPTSLVPIRVAVDVAPKNGNTTFVSVACSSNEGWYVGKVPGMWDGTFARAFASVLAQLRTAAPPVE